MTLVDYADKFCFCMLIDVKFVFYILCSLLWSCVFSSLRRGTVFGRLFGTDSLEWGNFRVSEGFERWEL